MSPLRGDPDKLPEQHASLEERVRNLEMQSIRLVFQSDDPTPGTVLGANATATLLMPISVPRSCILHLSGQAHLVFYDPTAGVQSSTLTGGVDGVAIPDMVNGFRTNSAPGTGHALAATGSVEVGAGDHEVFLSVTNGPDLPDPTIDHWGLTVIAI